MRILGIDPGLTGALVLVDGTTHEVVEVHDMPTLPVRNKREISEVLLADLIDAMKPFAAFIERVHAMPRQGVSSTFTFGMGYGIIRGVLAAHHVPTRFVEPQNWQRRFGATADKKSNRAIAIRIFPHNPKQFLSVKSAGRADAALIALYGALETIPDI
jgi:crossover junction endodeoxyribonuclease RuvC